MRAQNKAIILFSLGLIAEIIGVYSCGMMAAVILLFPLSTVMLGLFFPQKKWSLYLGHFSCCFFVGSH